MKMVQLRTGTFLAAVGLVGLAAAQAKFTILSGTKRIGTASLSQALMPNGDKTVQLKLEMTGSNGQSVTVRSESRYDSKGAPIRQFLESIGTKPPSRRQVTATFEAAGAKAVVDESGARRIVEVPLVDTAPRQDVTQFWFIRDKPKLGATVKYYRFDADGLKWVLMASTYVGPRDVQVGRTKIKGYLIRDERAETIVDAAGLPLRITVGDVVFERVPPSQTE